MAIRYNKEFNKEIQQVVKNFNAKIARLEATEQEILPDKTSVKELKTVYQDRRQLKRKLRQLRSFSERGMEKVLLTPGGAEMTRWEFETGRADYIAAKRRIARTVKAGKATTKSPFLKNEELQNAEDKLSEMKKSYQQFTQSELNFINKLVDKELKHIYYEENFKVNLIRKFETIVHEKRGDDEKYNEELVRRLQKFTGAELLQIYKGEQGLSSIMEYADTEGMLQSTQLKSQAHVGAYIDKTRFDDIVEAFVNNLSIYEKKYKK